MQETLDSGLNLTQDTSFNVRLNLLEGAPAPANNQAGVDAMDRRIAEYEAAINADVGLSSEVRDALRDRLSRARSELATNGVTPALVQLLESARNAYAQHSSGAAQSAQNDRAMNEALGTYPLSAAGKARATAYANAWIRYDEDAIVTEEMRGTEGWSAQNRAAAEAGIRAQVTSASGREVARFAAEHPKVVQQVAERRESRFEQVRGMEQHDCDRNNSRNAEIFAALRNNRLLLIPESQRVLDMIRENRPREEINVEIEGLKARATDSVREFIESTAPGHAGEWLAPSVRAFRDDLSPQSRERIGDSAADTATLYTELLSNARNVDRANILLSQGRSITSISDPVLRDTAAALLFQQSGVGAAFSAQQMMREAEMVINVIEKGQDLTPQQQRLQQVITRANDQSIDIVTRANELNEALTAVNPGLRGMNPNEQRGYAIALLSFTQNQPGGIQEYYRMMQRGSATDATPQERADAREYFARMTAHMSQTLGVTVGQEDPLQNRELRRQVELLGRTVESGETSIGVGANGSLVYYSGRDGYQPHTQFSSLGNNANLESVGGYGQVVRHLYAGSSAEGVTEDYRTAVRLIDAYRLQTSPEGQRLIAELWTGNAGRAHAEILQDVQRLVTTERDSMQEFSATVYAGLNERQRAVFERSGLLQEGGEIDVGRLMQQVSDNKVTFASVYQQYLNTPTDQLRLVRPDLADARELREFATQLQAAHSVKHMLERRDIVANELLSHELNGTTPPVALVSEADRLSMIASYNPAVATPEQSANFDRAMYDYLMQDPYIREKEQAAQCQTPPQQSPLITNTIGVIRSVLTDDPLYFSEHTVGHYAPTAANEATQAEMPAAQVPSEQAPARIVSNYDARAPLDARETEGAAAIDWGKTDLEKAVLGVLQQMTTEVRYETFSASLDAASQRLSTEKNRTINLNKGDQSFISYNEIEAALIANGWRRPEDIDTDRNGVDDQDILRALATPNVANGQGTGRS